MMQRKNFRIIIAGLQHAGRLKLEVMLNNIGYFRIAPVGSFDELMTLINPINGFFDLLIINSELVTAGDIDVAQFCQKSQHIHHALIYDAQRPELLPLLVYESSAVHLSFPSPPDEIALQTLMRLVDPAPACARGHKVSNGGSCSNVLSQINCSL